MNADQEKFAEDVWARMRDASLRDVQFKSINIYTMRGLVEVFWSEISARLSAPSGTEPSAELAIKDLRDALTFLDQVRATVAAGEHTGGAGRDAREWLERAARDVARLSAPAAPQAPADHKLVPLEPTKAMLDAASAHLMTPLDGMSRSGHKGPYGVYKAMLAASPQAPAALGPVKLDVGQECNPPFPRGNMGPPP